MGGTGLGLNICRQLAELMGGQVDMESTAGAGSCFWAELPIERAAPLRERLLERDTALDVLRGARSLLAEDNVVNALVAEAMLKQRGAKVTTVINGADAIEAVEREQGAFDAVLLDLQMPVLGGVDATIAIRQRYGAPQLPIIALTADVLVSRTRYRAPPRHERLPLQTHRSGPAGRDARALGAADARPRRLKRRIAVANSCLRISSRERLGPP